MQALPKTVHECFSSRVQNHILFLTWLILTYAVLTFFRYLQSIESSLWLCFHNQHYSQVTFNLSPTLTESRWMFSGIRQKPASLLCLLGWIKSSKSPDLNTEYHTSLMRSTTNLIFTYTLQSAHRLSSLLIFAKLLWTSTHT